MTALVGPSGTEAPTPATRTGVAGAHTGFRFRPDIEGFRAVGVLLVVLFHASVPHLTGGFVGVDVFFVISGFLICSLLVQEHFRFGDISLRGFYARRARRIIPPAAAVIAASTLVIGFTQGSVDAVRGAVDFGSALLYLANWHFIAQGNNYLAGDASNSPALHLWSLSVEEQFYVVFPLLLVLSFGWSDSSGCQPCGSRPPSSARRARCPLPRELSSRRATPGMPTWPRGPAPGNSARAPCWP